MANDLVIRTPSWDDEQDKISTREWMEAQDTFDEFDILFAEHHTMFRWGALSFLPILTLISLLLQAVGMSPYMTLLLLLASIIYSAFAIKLTPSKPKPKVGILNLKGKRLPVVFFEGLTVVIPFLNTLQFFDRQKENKDWDFQEVHFRLKEIEADDGTDDYIGKLANALFREKVPEIGSGGIAAFEVGATFEIDWKNPTSLLALDDVGEFEGALNVLHDEMGGYLRGIGRRLTWLQATLGNDILAMWIIARMAGIPNSYIRDNMLPLTEERIATFMNEAFQNGVSLVRGVGVKLVRLDIKRVVAEESLATASQTAAIEELRRVGLIANAAALRAATKVILEGENGGEVNDGSISQADAMQAVLLNDPDARISKTVEDKRFGMDPQLISALPHIADALRVLFGKGETK